MIILHISIAILSLIVAGLALVRPSMRRVKAVAWLAGMTLMTGAVLIVQGANVWHVCMSGFVFTLLSGGAVTVSLRTMHRQQAMLHES